MLSRSDDDTTVQEATLTLSTTIDTNAGADLPSIGPQVRTALFVASS
jgi:hypothetical protein